MLNPKFILLLLFGFLINSCFSQDQECTTSLNDEGTSTDDCPYQFNCVDQVCVHKELFPLNVGEIFSSLLIMVMAGLANSGGIGGGAVMSPILLTLFKYDASKTIMLVYVLIFGGSLGTFLNVTFQRDIKTGKPLVLYDFMLIVGPVMLLGSNLGVMINRIIPPILTLAGLVYLMVTTSGQMFKKAKATYAKETQELSQALITPEGKAQNATEEIELDLMTKKPQFMTQEEFLPQEVKGILAEDDAYLPKRKIIILLCLLGFLMLVTLLRGTDKFHSFIGVEFCSTGYWGWFILGLVGCFFFYVRGAGIVKTNTEIKERYNCTNNNYNLNEENVKKLGIKGVFAGILAALLGIGGGMVLGTTLMKIGVQPQSMTTTANAFVVMTSFISLFQAFLFGGISTSELIFFFLISSVGSYTVSAGLSWLVRKTKRSSILLIILLFMIAIAGVTVPTLAVLKTIQNPSQMLSFKSLC